MSADVGKRKLDEMMATNKSEVTDAYTYTSDAFYVVAAPPRTAAAARARREQPHKRSRFV